MWLVLVVGMTCISDNPLATFGDFIGDLSGYPLLLVYALVAAALFYVVGLALLVWRWRRKKIEPQA